MTGAAYSSVLAGMRTIAAEEGWRSLYRGLGVSCIKQAPQTGARLRPCTHSGTQHLSIGGIWFWGMCTASSCRPSLLISCTAACTSLASIGAIVVDHKALLLPGITLWAYDSAKNLMKV